MQVTSISLALPNDGIHRGMEMEPFYMEKSTFQTCPMSTFHFPSWKCVDGEMCMRAFTSKSVEHLFSCFKTLVKIVFVSHYFFILYSLYLFVLISYIIMSFNGFLKLLCLMGV